MKLEEIEKVSLRQISRGEIDVTGKNLSSDALSAVKAGSLQRIADALEEIARQMAFNNGTLERITKIIDQGRK
jgi:hypothetical protein